MKPSARFDYVGRRELLPPVPVLRMRSVYGRCMRLLILLLCFVIAVVACASQAGSSASVPKSAIEQNADTKIPDAGAD